MSKKTYQTDVLVVGAGLAGICTALEVLSQGQRVLLLDGTGQERFGGQAKEAFGGMLLHNTPEQQRNKIIDSTESFWRDWQTAAQFRPEDKWAKRWAKAYVEHNRSDIYDWRSEEHTSELQSRFDLVCRLLLEKKNIRI